MKHIKHLLDVVDKVRDNVALGLMSDPGLSKTSQVKQWADDNGRHYQELVISQRMPSEISGMAMPIQETQKMEIFDFDTLLTLKDGDVLAFDEFSNGNIMTLNACLTLIQERMMLSGKKLPSLLIVAMGNPQGRIELLPQTKQRFWWVDVTFDANSWRNYMKKTWDVIVDNLLVEIIKEQYKQGFSHQEYNYWTPRTVENMFRIALAVDEDDPWWEINKVDNRIVKALYSTKRAQVLPAQIKKCIESFNAYCISNDIFYNAKFVDRFRAVETAADLAALDDAIAAGEYGDTGHKFIQYLRGNSDD